MSEPRPISAKAQRLIIQLTACFWLLVLVAVFLPTSDPLWRRAAQLLATYLAIWGLFFVVSQNRVRVAGRFVLITLGIVAAVIFLEAMVVLKLADFRALFATHPREPWYSPFNTVDRELIHIHRPYYSQHFVLPGDEASQMSLPPLGTYEFSIKCDRHGFRNDADHDNAGIVVLGDSFIEGIGVEASSLLTTQLGTLSSQKVVNLGQSWYGPQQEAVVLRRFGLPLKPKVCVWTFFEGNDLQDSIRFEQVMKDWDGFNWRINGRGDKSATKNLLRWLDKSSAAPAPTPRQIEVWSAKLKTPKGSTTAYFSYRIAQHPDIKSKGLGNLHRALSETFETCKKKDVAMIVLFVPTKSRVYFPFCEFPDESPYADYGTPADPFPKEVADLVRSVSPELHLIDLTETFTAAASRGDLGYFLDDSHWNERGHRMAAEAIHEYINTHKLLGKPSVSPSAQ